MKLKLRFMMLYRRYFPYYGKDPQYSKMMMEVHQGILNQSRSRKYTQQYMAVFQQYIRMNRTQRKAFVAKNPNFFPKDMQ